MHRKKKRWTRIVFAAALLAGVAALPPSHAEETQVFRGEYEWNNGGSDELEAEFTPDGEGTWKVKFRFRFSGKGNNWKGTAEGSLTDGGEVSGTAAWKESGRSWVFRGAIEDGVFSGTHAEVRDGKESDSGDFQPEALIDVEDGPLFLYRNSLS